MRSPCRPTWRRVGAVAGAPDRVLWLSYTGTSWNVQDEADLGKPSGYLFVPDTAAAPTRAKGTWRGADGKRGWEARATCTTFLHQHHLPPPAPPFSPGSARAALHPSGELRLRRLRGCAGYREGAGRAGVVGVRAV